MRGRALLAAGSALLAAACEHGVTLSGTITVPVEVQQAFSPDRPGLVRVSTSIPKTSVLDYRLAVLCEPTAAPLALSFFHDGFGCAKEGEVRVEVLEDVDQDLPCGAGQALWGETAAGALIAEGAATVFEGKTGSLGCESGADTIDVVLRRVAP